MINNKITLNYEQDGIAEQEFKRKLCEFFQNIKVSARAYLAKVTYDNINFHVALCLRVKNNNDHNFLQLGCEKIFKSIFLTVEHLDILFISEDQELSIRNVCSPFYTSINFQVQCPDFYLTSSEGYNLDTIVRGCFKRKRLYGKHPDGYLLCDIIPSIVGQPFGLGSKDINQIVIASKYKKFSLFPIQNYPCYVHVARLLIDNLDQRDYIKDSDIELIAWAELYKKKEDISKGSRS